jgi:hypothetical protein
MGMVHLPVFIEKHCGTFTFFKLTADSFKQGLNIISGQCLGYAPGEYCFKRLALLFIHIWVLAQPGSRAHGKYIQNLLNGAVRFIS